MILFHELPELMYNLRLIEDSISPGSDSENNGRYFLWRQLAQRESDAR